jgi:hypothetical protein
MPNSLSLITTLARSGALDRAWALFREGGYDRSTTDAAALAVKGRLLKDRAWRASGEARAILLGRAAVAYSAADVIEPQPYLLINAAACRALSGDVPHAILIANAVLERIECGDEVAETPYWIAATRAEAHLIKGDQATAEALLSEAQKLDPDGYEDHAVTLRQFKRLCLIAGRDIAWLDPFRPPVCLHFSGHLGIAETASSDLREKVDRVLSDLNVGFGYGALAAGADIIIAEALIARGAELHLVLPASVEDFCRLSVDPYDQGWRARFDACFGAATTVRIAARLEAEPFEPLATALASDLAMGSALLNARRLESKAVQLLVIDEGDGPFGGGQATARDGTSWRGSGHDQRILIAPRSAPVSPSSSKQEGRSDRRLAALLKLDFVGLNALGDSAYVRAYDDDIAPFFTRLRQQEIESRHMQGIGNALIFAFDRCGDATAYAHFIVDQWPADGLRLRIAGHYGLVLLVNGAYTGPALSTLEDISMATQDGAFTVSHAFATALQVSEAASTFDIQYTGDCHLRSDEAGTSLFTLSI